MTDYPAKDAHGNPRTPYAIRCPYHKLVYLTREDYVQQLKNAHVRWHCPMCENMVTFEDENYEQMQPGADAY